MPAVYSTRFLSAKGATSTGSFTVPNGYVAVVRDLDAYANSIAAAAIFLHGASGETLYWFDWGIATQEAVNWRGRQVYFAGESIEVEIAVGVADSVDYALSGYLLTSS